MRYRSLILVIVPWIVAAGSGCMTIGQQPNLLTTAQEKQLGANLSKQVVKQEKVLANPGIQQYVNQIGQRLARQSPRKDVSYEFTVIDAPKTINAFALPGGHLFVYTGLLKLCDNEAELASVMAHEIAHVAAYHHGETLTRQFGINLLLNAALGDNPSSAAKVTADLLSTAGAMKFSRDQEREADAMGMDMLFRAGYRPEAMVDFMEKMYAVERQRGSAPALPFLSSHPATAQRIAALKQETLRYPVDLRMKSPVYANRYRQEVLNKLN